MWSPLRAAALTGLLLAPAPLLAQVSIGKVEYFTEHRGWNQAGVGPLHQYVIAVAVTPAGHPTQVFAERDGAREPMTQFPQPLEPDTYVHWRRFDAAGGGAWKITAERGDARAEPVFTRALARPREISLAGNVRVVGSKVQPELRWTLPKQAAGIHRIRVGVRGGERILGKFLPLFYVSPALPPAARSFKIPPEVLSAGREVIFQVMLEELQDGRLANRSVAFSDPYRPR